MKKYASIIQRILFLFVLIFTLISSIAMAADDNSDKEDTRAKQHEAYFHIYPQDYYGYRGSDYLLKIPEYEYYWIFSSGGYEKDWKNALEDVPGKAFLYSNSIVFSDGKPSLYSKKNAALITGSRLISYNLFLYDSQTGERDWLLATHFDGVSNVLYNVTYLMAIPAKVIHFIFASFKMGAIVFMAEGTAAGLQTIAGALLWMVWETVIGGILAFFMIVPSFIIGAIFHPFQTLGMLFVSFGNNDTEINNLVSSIWYFIKAFFHSIWIIFSWQ